MVEAALEIECSSCDRVYWYDGEKGYPGTVECPKCGRENQIPEDG